MRNKLSKNQMIFFKFLKNYISRNKYSPTYSEMLDLLSAEGLRIKSNNSLAQYLKVLEKKGLIKNTSLPRGIKLIKEEEKQCCAIPFYGKANCGEALIFAEDTVNDYINISRKYISGDKNDYFFVEADGNSMNKDGINNGDMVLVRKKNNYLKNKNVVVIINGLATIKKYIEKDGITFLVPSSTNSKHKPIILHPEDDINFCGEVEKVFSFSDMDSKGGRS
ncbi:MAG: transcriptional repressor LexA [Patescibacteria group bacterium]